jgi:hypothetical protein
MTFAESMATSGPGSVATLGSGALVDSPACLQCGKAIPRPRKGQKACSPQHRWALWKAAQRTAAKARDRKIGEYLLTAEESLQAIRDLLGEGGGEDP